MLLPSSCSRSSAVATRRATFGQLYEHKAVGGSPDLHLSRTMAGRRDGNALHTAQATVRYTRDLEPSRGLARYISAPGAVPDGGLYASEAASAPTPVLSPADPCKFFKRLPYLMADDPPPFFAPTWSTASSQGSDAPFPSGPLPMSSEQYAGYFDNTTFMLGADETLQYSPSYASTEYSSSSDSSASVASSTTTSRHDFTATLHPASGMQAQTAAQTWPQCPLCYGWFHPRLLPDGRGYATLCDRCLMSQQPPSAQMVAPAPAHIPYSAPGLPFQPQPTLAVPSHGIGTGMAAYGLPIDPLYVGPVRALVPPQFPAVTGRSASQRSHSDSAVVHTLAPPAPTTGPDRRATASAPGPSSPTDTNATASGPVRLRVTSNATRAAAVGRRSEQTRRLYSCPYCPTTFTKRHNLDGHVRSHEGIRPFSCQWCNRRFTREADQRRHERDHCRMRPHNPPPPGPAIA